VAIKGSNDRDRSAIPKAHGTIRVTHSKNVFLRRTAYGGNLSSVTCFMPHCELLHFSRASDIKILYMYHLPSLHIPYKHILECGDICQFAIIEGVGGRTAYQSKGLSNCEHKSHTKHKHTPGLAHAADSFAPSVRFTCSSKISGFKVKKNMRTRGWKFILTLHTT
jgi:hypothetical protein